MTSPATPTYDTVKSTTDTNFELQVAFQSHLPFARKLEYYGGAFSKSSI